MQNDLRDLMRNPNLIPPEKQDLLTRIAAQAAVMDMPAYLVGGSVRDLLLEQQVNDLDIVVEGDALGVGYELVKKYGGRLTVHQKFRTCIWHLPLTWHLVPDTLDIITARSELYEAPGALPVVKPSVIEDDLRRRDFALNAMAVRLDGDHFGELLDGLGGGRDLEERLIRVLHPRSFLDDPTRVLRAIRYEQRYGFKIGAETLKLVDQETLAVLSGLSGERIRHEFDRILEEEFSARMLSRAAQLGILSAFQPELPKLNEICAGLMNSLPSDDIGINFDRVLLAYLLWLMDSDAEHLAQISWRFDFTSALTNTALALIQLRGDLTSLKGSKPSVWTIRLDKVPEMAIYALWLVAAEPALKEYIVKWRHVQANITGADLKAHGLPPGPRYQEILSHLRAAWLDGEVTSTENELSLLNKLI